MAHIKRTKLYEEVMARILELVGKDNMNQGDRLPSEKEMCELFGVSRMVIREAICALQSQDLIEVKHGSGIYVKDIKGKILVPISLSLRAGQEQMFNILKLRKGIESEAAYLAASDAKETDFAKLIKVMDAMDKAVDLGEGAKEDYEFHCALIESTHNDIYVKVFYDIIAKNFFDVTMSSQKNFSDSFGPRLVVIEEHMKIFKHIRNGQPDAARKAMWEHLNSVENKLHKLVPSD